MGGALLLVAVIYVAWATRLPLDTRSTVNPREWVGAIHVHTVASDGGGTLDEVAVVARDSGLDFLAVTDHNVWAMPTAEYRAETLLVLGEEARVPAGHVLVLGGEDPALRITRRREAEEAGSPLGPSVSSGSGLRVVAHPEGPAQPWLEWDPAAFDAIEIWNWDTDLRDDGWRDWSKALLLLPMRPVSAMLELLDRPTATLSRWDDLLSEGHRIAGLCSVDAHAHVPIGDRFALPFPAYRDLFKLARQHVLLSGDPTGDAAHDADLVTEALGQGRSFCSFDGVADGSGLVVRARNTAGSATLGGRLAWEAGSVRIAATTPEVSVPVLVRLFLDGVLVDEGAGPGYRSRPLPGPGAYRLEISLDLARGVVPWIFTNPIWVVE
jgi:hypothetical protein